MLSLAGIVPTGCRYILSKSDCRSGTDTLGIITRSTHYDYIDVTVGRHRGATGDKALSGAAADTLLLYECNRSLSGVADYGSAIASFTHPTVFARTKHHAQSDAHASRDETNDS